VAEAVGALVGKPVVITAAVEEPAEEVTAELAGDQAGGPAAEPAEGRVLSEAEGSQQT
jgi:hypothetical protein